MTRTVTRPAARQFPSRAVVWLLLGLVALVAAWTGGVSAAPSLGVLPDGVGPVVFVGLTTGRDDVIDALVEKIERVRDGETDVRFEADPDDDLADLYTAVEGLADDLATCRAERATEGRARTRDRDGTGSPRDASNRALRRLAEIGADADRSLDEKIQQVLALGRERLDTDGAFLSAIDEGAGTFEFSHTSGTDDVLPPGTVAPMGETYCRETIESDGVLAVTNASDAGWVDDPAYERWGLETYVGAPVTVGGTLEGTLAFVDPEPRDHAFTDDERAFVELASRWMGYELERERRQRELRETTDRLSAVVEASPAAIVALDRDDRVTVWNPAAERIFGWSADEVLGEPFPLSLPEDDDHPDLFERALDGETVTGVETQRRTKSGDLVDVSLSIAPYRDADGAIVGTMGAIEDITDRKEAERRLRDRERRLARYKDYTDEVLDAIDDVFYVIDEEGGFQRWNETLPAVTGYDDAEIEGMNAWDVFPEADRDRMRDAIARVFGGPGSRRIEAPIRTNEGEEIPYEFVASTVENPDGETELVGIGRDVTDRNRRQAALERTTNLLDQAQRIAEVGGWEYDVETGDLTLTDEFRRLHGIESADGPRIEDVLSQYHPDDVDYIRETVETAIETGQSYDMEVRLRTADGGTRWVRALGEPVGTSDETTALRGSIQDVTAAKEREAAIRALHDAAQGLLGTETATEAADLVVETAADVLDVSGVCLYLLDGEAGQLVPRACTDGYEAVTGGAPPVAVGAEDDAVWNSYATGTRRVFDDSDDVGGTLFSDPVGGGLLVPVGDHGVLVVTTAQAGVSVRTRQLVETLVATTEAALDRLESEASLRERDAELEARNRRLRRQIQLTDVIRRVDRSLVGANSQAEIETAVCEELADAADVAFAWIGSVDAGGETLVPGTWAGTGETYLDSVTLSLEEGTTEPAVIAARSGEPTVVSNVLADVSNERWRKDALDSSFRSIVAVPIAVEAYGHGVLAVYADEVDAFGDLELTVFAELGQTIANAINAVKTREALHADTLLELTLRIEAPDTFLAQVARRTDATVEYVGIGSQSGDETGVFFATDATGDVDAVLADLVSVTEHRLLGEEEDRHVFEAAVTGPVLASKLLRFGARPTSIRATPAEVTATVSVPTSTDVREFVETLRDSYSAVELVSRTDVTRATRTRQELVSDLLEGLTDRQLEVLRTAYYAGYFDWPRGSSGEEIAEMLGVTQPTVSRHLRLGQRAVLAELLEAEPATVGGP